MFLAGDAAALDPFRALLALAGGLPSLACQYLLWAACEEFFQGFLGMSTGRESPGQSTVDVTLERAGAQIMEAVGAAPEAQAAKRARLEGCGTSGKLVPCDIIVVSQLEPAGMRQEMRSLLPQVHLRSSAAIKELMPQNAKSN